MSRNLPRSFEFHCRREIEFRIDNAELDLWNYSQVVYFKKLGKIAFPSRKKILRIWNLITKSPECRFSVSGNIRDNFTNVRCIMKWNERLLIYGTYHAYFERRSKIFCFNIQSYKEVFSLVIPIKDIQAKGKILKLVKLDNDRFLVFFEINKNQFFYIYSFKNKKCLRRITNNLDRITKMKSSRTSRNRLVVASTNEPRPFDTRYYHQYRSISHYLLLFDLEEGFIKLRYKRQTDGPIRALDTFFEENKEFVIHKSNLWIYIHRIDDSSIHRKIHLPKNGFYSGCMFQNRYYVIGNKVGIVKIYDLSKKKNKECMVERQRSFPSGNPVLFFSSSDNEIFFFGCSAKNGSPTSRKERMKFVWVKYRSSFQEKDFLERSLYIQNELMVDGDQIFDFKKPENYVLRIVLDNLQIVSLKFLML